MLGKLLIYLVEVKGFEPSDPLVANEVLSR